MIISEKQIMQLITIVHAYIATMHRIGEYKNCETAQDLLAIINDQQSAQLKHHQELDKCQHNLMLCTYLHGEPDNKYRCTKCLMTYEEVNG